MTLTKGTLVWVTPAAGDNHLDSLIKWHGHLWIVDGRATQDTDSLNSNFYWCKSLASGTLYDWHVNEMTIHTEGGDNAHPAG